MTDHDESINIKITDKNPNKNGVLFIPKSFSEGTIFRYMNGDQRYNVYTEKEALEVELVSQEDGTMSTVWYAYDNNEYELREFGEVADKYTIKPGDEIWLSSIYSYNEKLFMSLRFFNYYPTKQGKRSKTSMAGTSSGVSKITKAMRKIQI